MPKLLGKSGSNKIVESRAPKREPMSKGVSVKGVSQIGSAMGDHVTDKSTPTSKPTDPLYQGKGYNPPVGPTDNVAAVGVGGGRTIHECGSQSALPVAKPMPAGRSILDNK